MRNKQVHLSDLELLRNLFCGNDASFGIYDPHKRLTTNAGDDHKISQNASVLFNLSDDPVKTSAETVFHFPTSAVIDRGNFFYFISNPDGTMRWIFPANGKSTHFLSFYNSTHPKAKARKALVKAAFRLGLKKKVSSGIFWVEQKSKNRVEVIAGGAGYSIFTGTIGANRKPVIELHDKKGITHFVKIGNSNESIQLIENERAMLTSLSKYDFSALSLPRPCEMVDPHFAKLTNIKPAAVLSANRITDAHLRALHELYAAHHEQMPVKSSAAWKAITTRMQWLEKENTVMNSIDQEKINSITAQLQWLCSEINIEEVIPVSFAHGDFTPWNMYSDGNRLYVYDWELAGSSMPMLMDLFHFIFQSQVLLFRNEFSDIKRSINTALSKPLTEKLVNKYSINAQLHYKLYLLFNISYYLRLYIHQIPIHVQAHWLVDTWDRALNDLKKDG